MGLLEQAQQGGGMTPQLAESAAQAGAPAPTAAEAGPVPAPAAAQAGPAPAPAAAPPAQGADGNLPIQENEATPEKQQEYERAMRAVAQVLYSNDKASNSIVDQIQPKGDKIGSTAKVSMLFIKTLDEKINMDESVVSAVTQESVERIIELAEARHGVEYTPPEAEKILGATWEGVQGMFGGDPERFSQFVQGLDGSKMQGLQQEHEARLNG